MRTLIRQGVSLEDRLRDLINLADRIRKLVESERKSIVERSEVLTAAEASLLFNQITSAIHEAVTDRETLSRIHSAFVRIIGNSRAAPFQLVASDGPAG